MAVLALGFIGEAIGGSIGGTILGVSAASIGGFIGSAIGGLLDNLLFPQKQNGPRLDDLRVQVSTYGNPIALLFGPENRLAGNVIWSTGLKETRHHQHNKIGIVTGSTYTYSASFAVALCEGTIKDFRKIWANGKLVWDASGSTGIINTGDPFGAQSSGLWAEIRFYPGDFDQLPDPTIEGVMGMGNVPAYRGTAYVVFTDYQLADYGNRIPNLEFLIEKDESITCAEVLSIIAERCGIDRNTVSTTSVEGLVRGYAIATQSSGTAALQQLALVYNFDTASVGGGLRFAPRGNGPCATIEPRQLAGHVWDDERPELISWTRALETSMPREASLSFADPERDYQINTQTARRQAGSADSNLSSQITIVVDVDTGRRLADRMMWEAWMGRTTATSNTDDRLIGLEPGRVYVFTTPAGFEPLRLKRRTRGADGVMELELARDRSEVYRSAALGVEAPVPHQTVNVPGPSILALLDSPILADSDDDTGFYYLVDGLTAGWRGADVVRSMDGGATFDEVAPDGFRAKLGTIDMLGDGVTAVFDYANTMRVTLQSDSDELVSATELAVLNGANAAWVGPQNGHDGEVLQFTTAALVAPGVYDVTGFLRGRLGTEFATGTHSTGDLFVLLETGPLQRIDYSPSDWNKERVYKAVSLLTAEADADPEPFTNTGEGKRPLSPVFVKGDEVAGDLVISWIRRSRLRQPGLGGGPLALGESTEAYEVDILAGSTVVRTLSSTSPTVTYTAAMQATDGLSSGDTVHVGVYQMSDVRGRGRPAFAELSA